MRLLYLILRSITRLNDRLGQIISLLVIVMFVLLLAEVALRYVFGAPAVWTGELTQMLFGAYAVLGGAYVMAHHGHVNVDILYARFSPRVRAGIDIATFGMVLIFVGAVLYHGASFAADAMSYWERSQSAWGPPLWPVKLTIPIGAALLLLQCFVKLATDILILVGVEDPNQHIAVQGPEDTL